jgi:protocatechuate 3,4-dioxygenase, beta subunit
MSLPIIPPVQPLRRRLLALAAATSAAVSAKAWSAILKTPAMTEGPFYPVELPLDQDNDLTRVAGKKGTASGELLDFAGRVLDESGAAVAGAVVEIWQCNAFGVYHHPSDSGKVDPNFQGFGKTTTDAQGRYRFRTIKPVAYSGRVPHIHYKVKRTGKPELTSQVMLAGETGNERDFVFRSMRDAEARKRVLMTLAQAPKDSGAKWATEFEIVVA